MYNNEDVRYIYCFSNASLDIYPENTLSKFTNQLAIPIDLDRNEKWRISLQKFQCHNLLRDDDKSHLIQVECDELLSKANTANIISLHARKPYNTSRDKIHYFEPKTKEWFELGQNHIDKLTFTLLDSEGKQLQLARGQTTWILLELRKMTRDYEEHVLRVSSKKTEKFSENTPSNFYADFPAQFSYYGNSPFEIACSSITYTPRFRQMTFDVRRERDERTYGLVKFELFNRNNPFEPLDSGTVKYSPERNFKCDEELVDYIQARVFELFTTLHKHKKDYEGMGIKYRKDVGRVKLVAPALGPDNMIKIWFPKEMSMQLGLRDENQLYENGLGLVELKDPTKMYSAEYAIDLTVHYPESLLLYTNFTKPSLCGAGQSSILKVFPIQLDKIEESKFVTQEAINLEYFKLEPAMLTNLNFKLLTVAGNEVQFYNQQDAEVLLTLIMRRVKKKNDFVGIHMY
jgi:hypothetical protein